MPVVRLDEKGRIQIPREVREAWRLKPKQPMLVSVARDSLSVTKLSKPTPETDPLLRDILKRPLRLKKVKLTKRLLDRLEDEVWMP